MLVLSRQRDETIMIGDEIEITVVDIRGDKVRLGINAPTKVAVHRKEVYEAIKRENEQASRLLGQEFNGVRPGVSASSRPLPLKPQTPSKASLLSGGQVPQGSPATGTSPPQAHPPSPTLRAAGA